MLRALCDLLWSLPCLQDMQPHLAAVRATLRKFTTTCGYTTQFDYWKVRHWWYLVLHMPHGQRCNPVQALMCVG